MKKILQSHFERLKPAKVYLDDIKEIIGFLENTCKEVEIQSGDNLLDSLGELQSLKKEVLHDLTISGKQPYISVDMNPDSLSLYITEDTPESRGLFEKVKDVLVRCRRPFTWLLHNSFLSGIPWGFAVFFALLGAKTQSWSLATLSVILSLLGLIWVFYSIRDWSKRYTVIVPRHRIESPGFVKRNKDKILLAIFSAIFGALVTYLLTHLQK